MRIGIAKKSFYILTTAVLILASLGFNVPKASAALDSRCKLETNGAVTCKIGFNETLNMTVQAKDDAGNTISGVKDLFTWDITPSLGYFTTVDGKAQPVPPAATVTHILSSPGKLDGYSTATIKVLQASTGGTVKATAVYGQITINAVYNINSYCNLSSNPPKLYYGIGSIRPSGGSDWESSTAEVIETCSMDYRLYEGTGEGK